MLTDVIEGHMQATLTTIQHRDNFASVGAGARVCGIEELCGQTYYTSLDLEELHSAERAPIIQRQTAGKTHSYRARLRRGAQCH